MSATPLVQSLSRGLRLLDWIAESPEGLALAEMATRLEVSQPTAFNLARTLVAHGYLAKTPRPVRYRLGPAATALHQIHNERSWLVRAEQALHSLATDLPGTFLFLCETGSGDVRVVRRLDPASPQTLEHTTARIVVPYVMAISLGFLAFAHADDQALYRTTYPFEEYGRGRWRSPQELEDYLTAAREAKQMTITAPSPCRVVVPLWGTRHSLLGLICAARPANPGETPTAVCNQLRRRLLTAAHELNPVP
ncbi:MAG: helix-turn-helix domain-containing protein [Victivallales bacterium]|nr:helix-turn-helix domain-containing protein [Victivallales bacterium]